VIDSSGVVAVGFGIRKKSVSMFTDATSSEVVKNGTTYTFRPADALSDGTYEVKVVARDSAGNVQISLPLSFTLSTPSIPTPDTTPPPAPIVVAPVVVAPVVAPPVVPAPIIVPAPAPAPIESPPGVSTAGLSNAFAAIPGGLTKEAAQTVSTALTAVDTATAQGFVDTMSALPPAQAAEVLKQMASSTPEEAKATVQFMSTLAAGTEVAKSTTAVSADGKETKTFSLDDEVAASGATIDGVEVAGVRSATTGKRTVAILVKAGQVARINRSKSGIWPDLTFPLLSGKLSGVAPVIALPADATSVTFEPTPAGLNTVQQGSLGGGNVVPLGLPFTFKVLSDSRSARVQFSLPSIKVGSGQTLGYLYSIASSTGGFAGYLRAPAEFDAATTRQTWTLSTAEVADMLILPVALQPAFVQNFNADAHIYSGPDEFGVDFGEAGPAFTTFTVVGPQVGTRIYVYSPVSGGYGWIEASGVGPSGPPLN